MESHLGLVEDLRLFTLSAFHEIGCLFNGWPQVFTQISESGRHFHHFEERRMATSHRPNIILSCENSRGTKFGENSTNKRQYKRQKADESTLPSCVTMKKLPFYDHKKDIFKSWYHAPIFHTKKSFSFVITSDVAKSVDEQDYKLLLRFCRLDSSCEQDDKYPPKVLVHVNGKVCDTKDGPIPVNITTMCDFTSGTVNMIQVSSSSGNGEYYVVSLSLVKKLTVNDLMCRLKMKKPSKIQDTRSLIKSIVKQDKDSDGVVTTTLQCSLLCPLAMTRMSVPCRGIYCQHFQCFDAVAYLHMNEQKSLWTCPVCNCPALFPDLIIDGYFQEVLAQANECNKVSFLQDGSWTSTAVFEQYTHTKEHQGTTRKRTFVEMIIIDSDGEYPNTENEQEAKKIRKANGVFHNARSLHKNFADDPLETCRLSETERSKRQKRKGRPRSSR